MKLTDSCSLPVNPNERVQVFVDGSNLYHGLKKDCKKTQLDYSKFAAKLCRGRRLIRITYYSGTLDAQKDPAAAKEQQKFLGRLRQIPYITVKTRPLTYKNNDVKVEKGVDILIATDMLTGALRNAYDTAVLVSGDGDFAPVLEEIKREGKQIENATFTSCRSDALVNAADLFIELTNGCLTDCFR